MSLSFEWKDQGAQMHNQPLAEGEMNQAKRAVLLVSKAGRVRDALASLLSAASSNIVVKCLEYHEVDLVMQDSENPALIIIEGSVRDAVLHEIILQAKEKCPSANLLVFTEKSEQRDIAQKEGALCVLPGTPIGNLNEVIQKMLD